MKGVCVDCQQEKEIIAKGKCWPCYQRERRKTYIPPPPKKGLCSICGKEKQVRARKDGQAVCPACHKRQKRRAKAVSPA